MSLEAFTAELKDKVRDIYSSDAEEGIRQSENILCPQCQQPGVKPTTVLYGSSLPPEFFTAMKADSSSSPGPLVDLILTIGTSLEVGPANLVPEIGAQFPSGRKPKRIFINLGEYSSSVMSGIGIGRSDRDIVIHEEADKFCQEALSQMSL